MKKHIVSILFLVMGFFLSAQEVTLSGAIRLTDRDNTHFEIQVKNQRTGITSVTNMFRRFTLNAQVGDMLYITGDNVYDNNVTVVQSNVDSKQIIIVMNPIYIELEEFVFKPLSGILKKDLANQDIETESRRLLRSLGIQLAITDGRRNTEEILPSITSLNVDALYDLLSGNSKKRERLYTYEDKHKKLQKLREYYRKEYFTEELQIPEPEIDFFVEYVWDKTDCEVLLNKYDFSTITQLFEQYKGLYYLFKNKKEDKEETYKSHEK